MQDILEGKNLEVKIGEHGVVRLLDCMPRLVDRTGYSGPIGFNAPELRNLDHAVCEAARVSYGAQDKVCSEKVDRGLIRFLWRKHHGTPFEMCQMKFYIAMPIFVARQLIRHRMSSTNEYSMRYKEPKDAFFIPAPEEVRKQSKNNKQGSEGQVDESSAKLFAAQTKIVAEEALREYGAHVNAGIGKEIARINLPLSTFTYWYWRNDLRNLLGFMALRRDKHAQKEIRDYAEAMWSLVQPLAPWTCEAFEDFTFEAVTLTKLEAELLKGQLSAIGAAKLGDRATERECEEWVEKLKRLNGE